MDTSRRASTQAAQQTTREQVADREDHAAMISARKTAPAPATERPEARSSNRAPQDSTPTSTAPAALGAGRCREIDEEIGLPVLRAALENLAASGELVAQPVEMLARVLFGALCEAAMAAGADPHPARAGRQAATALKALTNGLRQQP